MRILLDFGILTFDIVFNEKAGGTTMSGLRPLKFLSQVQVHGISDRAVSYAGNIVSSQWLPLIKH